MRWLLGHSDGMTFIREMSLDPVSVDPGLSHWMQLHPFSSAREIKRGTLPSDTLDAIPCSLIIY